MKWSEYLSLCQVPSCHWVYIVPQIKGLYSNHWVVWESARLPLVYCWRVGFVVVRYLVINSTLVADCVVVLSGRLVAFWVVVCFYCSVSLIRQLVFSFFNYRRNENLWDFMGGCLVFKSLSWLSSHRFCLRSLLNIRIFRIVRRIVGNYPVLPFFCWCVRPSITR